MGEKTVQGRDVLTGAALSVTVNDGWVQQVASLKTRDPLPWLSPGLVDLQINGFGGFDLNAEDVTVDDVLGMVATLREAGTAYWVPTIITGSFEHIEHCLHVLRDACSDPEVRATIPFAHLEGPYISPEDGPRGAHARDQVRDVDLVELQRWHQVFPIGYVTISPHWDDIQAKVSAITRMGIEVSIGHTHATHEDVRRASLAGAAFSTHLGNGCPSNLPRHPNFIWEQIADRTLTAGLIADGHHLPAHFIESVVRAKSPDRCFLVSDSVALAGSQPGRYTAAVGGDVILQPDGRLCLAEDERLLAGSAVCLADCVRFLTRESSLTTFDIFTMATTVPGFWFGQIARSPVVGRLRAGAPARLLQWDDEFAIIDRTW